MVTHVGPKSVLVTVAGVAGAAGAAKGSNVSGLWRVRRCQHCNVPMARFGELQGHWRRCTR